MKYYHDACNKEYIYATKSLTLYFEENCYLRREKCLHALYTTELRCQILNCLEEWDFVSLKIIYLSGKKFFYLIPGLFEEGATCFVLTLSVDFQKVNLEAMLNYANFVR